jgi:hypothetical protein
MRELITMIDEKRELVNGATGSPGVVSERLYGKRFSP